MFRSERRNGETPGQKRAKSASQNRNSIDQLRPTFTVPRKRKALIARKSRLFSIHAISMSVMLRQSNLI
jgi:hypothetical protein